MSNDVARGREPVQKTLLLKLPSPGCLRIIHKVTGEWTEFELGDVLVVVLPGHPVGVNVP